MVTRRSGTRERASGARGGPPEDRAPGEEIDVRVHGLAPGGDAVGRQQGGAHDGRATFIPLAAPGDEVRARVTRQKARVAWAELVELRTSSPVRVVPPCPYFGTCGGCQWQHVALEAQRAAKREIVERALGTPIDDVLAPSPSGFAYRDRARLVVGANGKVGFRARRSHDVVDIERCLLLGGAAAQALSALRADAAKLAPGTELDLQAGEEGVHVALRSHGPVDAALAAAVFEAGRAGGVVGLSGPGGRGAPSRWGAADVDATEPGGPPLRLPAGGFAQVGRTANAALVQAVMGALGDAPGDVLELYAGSGNFTRHLLTRTSRVVAHDADARAVERGRLNAPQARWQLGPPPTGHDAAADTTVVDPPREGLDPDNFDAAVRARRRLIYISCDPQTLGRDANKLRAQGFVLRCALALDLMPQTFHVEVVAIFDRP